MAALALCLSPGIPDFTEVLRIKEWKQRRVGKYRTQKRLCALYGGLNWSWLTTVKSGHEASLQPCTLIRGFAATTTEGLNTYSLFLNLGCSVTCSGQQNAPWYVSPKPSPQKPTCFYSHYWNPAAIQISLLDEMVGDTWPNCPSCQIDNHLNPRSRATSLTCRWSQIAQGNPAESRLNSQSPVRELNKWGCF